MLVVAVGTHTQGDSYHYLFNRRLIIPLTPEDEAGLSSLYGGRGISPRFFLPSGKAFQLQCELSREIQNRVPHVLHLVLFVDTRDSHKRSLPYVGARNRSHSQNTTLFLLRYCITANTVPLSAKPSARLSYTPHASLTPSTLEFSSYAQLDPVPPRAARLALLLHLALLHHQRTLSPPARAA